ncbi:PspA/IM30 family protein [Priestia megaterium]|nr:PspA/IM30 family protein [Priestia megaterium]
MRNLFTRVKETISADIHQLLDQKEQKNPIVALNHYLRQCEQETERVRKLVERQYLLKEQFIREYQSAEAMKEKRKQQAEVAMRAEESELHEFVMKEYAHYEERANRLKESLQHTVKQLDELEHKYEEMKHKLKDMHIRRMELMGRENVARANHRMNHVLKDHRISMGSFTQFEEMEGYIDRLEHQINTDYYRQTIDSKIAALEKEVK